MGGKKKRKRDDAGDDTKEDAEEVVGKEGTNKKRQEKRESKKHARFAHGEKPEMPSLVKPKTQGKDSEPVEKEEQPRAPETRRSPGHPLRIFIGGLPKLVSLDAKVVRAAFEKCGEIKD